MTKKKKARSNGKQPRVGAKPRAIKQITDERLKEIRELDRDIALGQAALMEKQATYRKKVTEALAAIHVRNVSNGLCLECGTVCRLQMVQTQEGIQQAMEPCGVCQPVVTQG